MPVVGHVRYRTLQGKLANIQSEIQSALKWAERVTVEEESLQAMIFHCKVAHFAITKKQKPKLKMKMKSGYTLPELCLIVAIFGLFVACMLGIRSSLADRSQAKGVLKSASLKSVPAKSAPVTAYAPPEFSVQGQQDYGRANPKDFIAPDSGNVVDLDGDGINDFVMLREGGRLMWAKGRADGTVAEDVCVLMVRDFCRGYYVRLLPGHKRPTFLFWDVDYHQFRQECLGLTENGIPYFGGVEQ